MAKLKWWSKRSIGQKVAITAGGAVMVTATVGATAYLIHRSRKSSQDDLDVNIRTMLHDSQRKLSYYYTTYASTPLPLESEDLGGKDRGTFSERGQKFYDYYSQYASVSQEEMDKNRQVVEEAKRIALDYFRLIGQNELIRVISIEDVGSAKEGLKVIAADEFDLAVNFGITVKASLHSKHTSPGYSKIRAVDNYDSTAEMQRSKYPIVFDEGEYVLSPQLIRERFQSMLAKAFFEHSAKFKVKTQGPALTITTIPGPNIPTIDIDFVPTITIEGRRFVAKPHPEWQKRGNERFQYCWMQSYAQEEAALINSLPDGDVSCHRACLQIVKAIRQNHKPQLGCFSSYVYKTVMLNLLKKRPSLYQWTWGKLEERIEEYFKEFLDCVDRGNIPHHMVRGLNLIESIGTVQRHNVVNYLSPRVSGDQLLKRRDVSATVGEKVKEEGATD